MAKRVRVTVFDQQFSKRRGHTIAQCLLAVVFMLCVLLAFGMAGGQGGLDVVGASSIGASTFLCFVMPNLPVSDLRHILLSYAFAITIGLGAHYATYLLIIYGHCPHLLAYQLCGALAMGLTMFAMVITNSEHPPAAGLALGLVVEAWGASSILVICGAALSLCALKFVLRTWLISLL